MLAGALTWANLCAQLGEFRFEAAAGDTILITAITPKPDGGLYALGFNHAISSGSFGNQSRSESLLLDISADNTVNWVKQYDLGIGYHNRVYSIMTTQDGGIVSGGTRGTIFGQSSYLQPIGIVQKYNAEGEVEWMSGTGVDYTVTRGHIVIEASDGGYFLLGRRYVVFASGTTLGLVLSLSKFGNDGSLLWNRIYDVPSPDSNRFMQGVYLEELPDGDCIVVGRINDQSFIMRLDAQGLPVWSKTYGHTNFSTSGIKILPLGDGTFVIAKRAIHNVQGSTNQVVVMRIDGDGTTIWSRQIALAQPLADPSAGSATPFASITGFERTNDGHLLIAAESDFSGSGDLRPALIKIAYDGSWVWGKELLERSTFTDQTGAIQRLAVTANDLYALVYHRGDEPTAFRLVKVDADGRGACTNDIPASVLAPVNLVEAPVVLDRSESGGPVDVPYTVTEPSFLVEQVSINVGIALLNDTLLCDDSLVLAPSLMGEASYLWQDGSTAPTLTVTQAGEYALTVDIDGCTASDTASVFTVEGAVDLGADRTACMGDTLVLAPAFVLPGDYQWGTGANTPSLAITQNGVYDLTLSTACGVLADSIEVRFLTPPTLNPTLGPPTCGEENGQISIAPTDGDTLTGIQWFGPGGGLLAQGVNQLSGLGEGAYELVATVGTGCVVEASFDFVASPLPTAVPIVRPPNCPGQSDGFIELANLSGTAPFTFQWSQDGQLLPDTDARVEALAPGLYAYTLTDADGCTQVQDSISLPEALPISFVPNATDADCPGEATGSIALVNTGGSAASHTFQLNGGPPQAGAAFVGLAAGNYRILIEDNRGCDTLLTVDLAEAEAPSFMLQASANPVSFGEIVQLQVLGLAGADTLGGLRWSAEPPLPFSCTACLAAEATATRSADLHFELLLPGGCVFTQSLRLEVEQDRRLYIPTAFSPNGDGRNDRFELYPGPGVAQVRHFLVFDRWGGLVFEAQNGQPGWDGQVLGKPAVPGAYTYTVLVEWVDGRLDRYMGAVQLMR